MKTEGKLAKCLFWMGFDLINKLIRKASAHLSIAISIVKKPFIARWVNGRSVGTRRGNI